MLQLYTTTSHISASSTVCNMKVSSSIFLFFFLAPVTQAQQIPIPIPIKNNDPLNDGIYIRSVTLPQHTKTGASFDTEQNGDDDDVSSNVNDGNHINNEDNINIISSRKHSRNNDNRERLIMYDFKPAYPFYTKETLDEVLLLPQNDVVGDEGDEERVWIEGQNDDEAEEILNSDEAVIDEDVVVSEGEDDDAAKQGEPTSHEKVDVNDDDEKGSDASSLDYPVVYETEPSPLDNEQPSTINNEEGEADKSLQQSETLNLEEKEEGTAIHSEEKRNDDEPPYPAPLNERNYNDESTIYPEDLPTPTGDTEKMHQPLPTQHLQSTSTESGEDDLDAKNELVVDDDFISDAPEAGERIVVTINEDNEIVEQESQQQEEEGVSVSIDPVSEFDIESIVKDDGSIDNKDVEGNNKEDLQSDVAPESSETIVDTQANVEEEDTNAQEKESGQSDSPKVTIQYDSDQDTKQSSSSTSSSPTTASNTNNKDANRQFVDGLDEIDKLFESVEVPDELDVGADGSSMQDVLVGQGIKIIWKRVKNISMGVKTKVNGITESVKNVLLPLQLDNIWKSYDDDSDEDLTLDSLLDLNNKLKKDDNTDGKMKKPQQQDNDSQSSKSNNEKDKSKKDFPLIKSPKAQKIWKWSIKKWRQAKHILDDLLSLIGADDGDDDDDNFGLGDLGLDDIQLGNTMGSRAKFGSEVDESFIKARVEEMMKDQQQQLQAK